MKADVVWAVPPLWKDQRCYIVAGGPSVRGQDLSVLRGRNVIAINSSYADVPFAQFLFFGDARWWRLHAAKIAASGFAGRIVSAFSPRGWPAEFPNVSWLRKLQPPGLSDDRSAVRMSYTSLSGAANVAKHTAVRSIVLLGADGRDAPDGRTHHHEPHPWPRRDGCYDRQRCEIEGVAVALRADGIEVLNASHGSAYSDLWPVVDLRDCL